MALTEAQRDLHLRRVVVGVAARLSPQSETFMELLRGCIRHYRTAQDAGDIALNGANTEAARVMAQALFEAVIKRSATSADLHYLKAHLALDADSSAGGVL